MAQKSKQNAVPTYRLYINLKISILTKEEQQIRLLIRHSNYVTHEKKRENKLCNDMW